MTLAAGALALAGLAACQPQFPTDAALTVTPGPTGPRVAWPAAVELDDGQQVASYRVDIDGQQVALLPASVRSCVLTGLSIGDHAVRVTAYDDQGEWSGTRTTEDDATATVTATTATGGSPDCTRTTVRISPNGGLTGPLSGDGRFVVYGDLTGATLLHDRTTGTSTPRPELAGTQVLDLSADGSEVLVATGQALLPADTNVRTDLYLIDLTGGPTELVATPTDTLGGVLSGDGSHVAFSSWSYAPEPPPSVAYSWDRATGATTTVAAGPRSAEVTSISADGRYVLYQQDVLKPGTSTFVSQLFRWDETTGTATQLTFGNGSSTIGALSGDGSHVAFSSQATDLVAGDTNGFTDLFRLEVASLAITRIATTDRSETFSPQISADGSAVAFSSASTSIVAPDTNGREDVYLWTLGSGTEVVARGNGNSLFPFLSDDGKVVELYSGATDLVPDDTNGRSDLFVWDAR